MKPLQIDDLLRPDHHWLDDDDECFYLTEYKKGKEFLSLPGVNLINNFKKQIDRRGRPEYKYKGYAISEVAGYYKAALTKRRLESTTFVPIPPSKAKDHPLYDDRNLKVLKELCEGVDGDVRELLFLTETIEASHAAEQRKTPDELMEYLSIDKKQCAKKPRSRIVLFDDVIVAGAHFKACKNKILERFPGVTVAGMFIARRVPPKLRIIIK